ncbi:hypothetical protein PHSC3_001437 [Chlamydiales bacterium STE3]|nr:hypothetical protein PHSC3_001437 [Chlamydiales bacterium STE3]
MRKTPLKPLKDHIVFATKDKDKPKNQAECIFYCCRFLSLEQQASSELVNQTIDTSFHGHADDNVHKTSLSFNGRFNLYRKIPFLIEKNEIDYFGLRVDQLDNEYINLEADQEAYERFFKLIETIAPIHGGIITGNKIAIAFRKRRGFFEFFDPTGECFLTQNNGHPYVVISKNASDAATYLFQRFPAGPEGREFASPLNCWPIHHL